MWEYTDKVKEHFLNPRNVGVIEDAEYETKEFQLEAGDKLLVYSDGVEAAFDGLAKGDVLERKVLIGADDVLDVTGQFGQIRIFVEHL